MPRASQAISLLLVGTGLCAYAYEASSIRQMRRQQSATQPSDYWNTSSTQPSNYRRNSSSYSHYGGGYHTWGGGSYDGSSDFHGSSFGATERGGFGAHGLGGVGHGGGE